MNDEAGNSCFVSMYVYMHLAFKELRRHIASRDLSLGSKNVPQHYSRDKDVALQSYTGDQTIIYSDC